MAARGPVINTGDSALRDVDNWRAAMGIYGGVNGDAFDLDYDTSKHHFWPGTITTSHSSTYKPGNTSATTETDANAWA